MNESYQFCDYSILQFYLLFTMLIFLYKLGGAPGHGSLLYLMFCSG